MTELIDLVREQAQANFVELEHRKLELAQINVSVAGAGKIAELTQRRATVARLHTFLQGLLCRNADGRVTGPLAQREAIKPYAPTMSNLGAQRILPFELRVREEVAMLHERLEGGTSQLSRRAFELDVQAAQRKGDALGALQRQISWHAEEGVLNEMQRLLAIWEQVRTREFLDLPETAQAPSSQRRVTRTATSRTLDRLNGSTARDGAAAAAALIVG